MSSFENTKIAFRSKSNYELKKAYFLFRMMSNSTLVSLGDFATKLALGLHLPVSWAVKPTLYGHFVGGETIDDCKKNVKALSEYNLKSILDYSMEGGQSEKEMENTLAETLRTIENAASNPNVPFAVFKPTAFASAVVLEKASAKTPMNAEEKRQAETFKKHVNILCQAAYKADVPILIDAEDTYYQQFIDDVITEMMEKYNHEKAIVFNTLQMYRHDRMDFLKEAYKKAIAGNYFLGIKYVRGAYMEKERERAAEKGYPSPIQPDKDATDHDYNEALKFSIEHIDKISVFNGTHNEYSSTFMTELMKKHGIAPDDPRCYFSQLYGMSDHISFNLAEQGYNVAKYMPYGKVKHVLPYLLRRAQENTSVKGQTSRELSLLITEMKRRKSS